MNSNKLSIIYIFIFGIFICSSCEKNEVLSRKIDKTDSNIEIIHFKNDNSDTVRVIYRNVINNDTLIKYNLVNSLKEGFFISYSKDKELKELHNYSRGKIQGKSKYYEDTKLRILRNYCFGKRCGEELIFENEKLFELNKYENDSIYAKIIFDTSVQVKNKAEYQYIFIYPKYSRVFNRYFLKDELNFSLKCKKFNSSFDSTIWTKVTLYRNNKKLFEKREQIGTNLKKYKWVLDSIGVYRLTIQTVCPFNSKSKAELPVSTKEFNFEVVSPDSYEKSN